MSGNRPLPGSYSICCFMSFLGLVIRLYIYIYGLGDCCDSAMLAIRSFSGSDCMYICFIQNEVASGIRLYIYDLSTSGIRSLLGSVFFCENG